MNEINVGDRVRYRIVVGATRHWPQHLEDREGTVVDFDTCPWTGFRRAVIRTPGETTNRRLWLVRLTKL